MKIINDNIRPFDAISERDLHAYVDGQLNERSRRRVEAWLAQHPDAAEEVRDYMRYNALLREAYQGAETEPVPLRLLSVINRSPRRLAPAALRTAAVVLLCALSAGSGWQAAVNQYSAAGTGNSMVENFLQQIASNDHSAGTIPGPDSQIEKVALNMSGQIDPLNWLTQKVALEMQAPDLSPAGYRLEGRQLITRNGQEFVALTYRNNDDDNIGLFMKTRWDKQPPIIEFMHQNDTAIAHWQEGPLVYALTGTMTQDGAVQIADLIRNAMSHVPASTDIQAPELPHDILKLKPQPVAPPLTAQTAPAPASPGYTMAGEAILNGGAIHTEPAPVPEQLLSPLEDNFSPVSY